MLRRICWTDTGSKAEIAGFLRDGELVICTTDTVPGLLSLATEDGLKMLDRAKGRSGKSYLIVVGSRQQAYDLMDRDKVADHAHVQKLIEQCWPGPLTLIVPAHPSVSPAITREGTIAIRLPDHEGLRELAREAGALFSTSANPEGEPTPCRMDGVDEQIMTQASARVDDCRHMEPCKRPSTILDCTGDAIRVVRQGAYSHEDLAKIVPISTSSER